MELSEIPQTIMYPKWSALSSLTPNDSKMNTITVKSMSPHLVTFLEKF